MRKMWVASACLVGLTVLAGCAQGRQTMATRAIDSVAEIDQENMAEMMLAVADPREAVEYFTRASEASPDRIVLSRGLARSLMRAGNAADSIPVWRRVIDHPEAASNGTAPTAFTKLRRT